MLTLKITLQRMQNVKLKRRMSLHQFCVKSIYVILIFECLYERNSYAQFIIIIISAWCDYFWFGYFFVVSENLRFAGINIYSSEIILYHFKPKEKTCRGVFCLKLLSYHLSFLSFCFDIIGVSLKYKKKVTYKNHLA